jgi:hypothetical protein
MSTYIAFHDVKKVEVGEDKVLKTDMPFSARQVTLTFADGSEFRFSIYGEVTGIPVDVQERKAVALRAAA